MDRAISGSLDAPKITAAIARTNTQLSGLSNIAINAPPTMMNPSINDMPPSAERGRLQLGRPAPNVPLGAPQDNAATLVRGARVGPGAAVQRVESRAAKERAV